GHGLHRAVQAVHGFDADAYAALNPLRLSAHKSVTIKHLSGTLEPDAHKFREAESAYEQKTADQECRSAGGARVAWGKSAGQCVDGHDPGEGPFVFLRRAKAAGAGAGRFALQVLRRKTARGVDPLVTGAIS